MLKHFLSVALGLVIGAVTLAAGTFVFVFTPTTNSLSSCILVFGAILLLGLYLVGRRVKAPVTVIAAGLIAFFGPTLMILTDRPGSNPIPKPAPAGAEVQYWDLPTGSRIGYVLFEPEFPNGASPVVVLHGGPGGGLTGRDIDESRNLAKEGFTVYAYDQAGVGYSDSIETSEYTVERMVDDLEAIRQVIDTPKIILWGHSWGGALAANYVGRFAENIEQLVLSAPVRHVGPTPEHDDPIMTEAERPGSIEFKRAPPISFVFYFQLLGINPEAAFSFMSEDRVATFAQDYIALEGVMESGICKGDEYGEISPLMENSNFNFGANILITQDLNNLKIDYSFSDFDTPTLVVRGFCDYLPWVTHARYRDEIPGARMVIVPNNGHLLYSADTVAAFLKDELPESAYYTAEENPALPN